MSPYRYDPWRDSDAIPRGAMATLGTGRGETKTSMALSRRYTNMTALWRCDSGAMAEYRAAKQGTALSGDSGMVGWRYAPWRGRYRVLAAL